MNILNVERAINALPPGRSRRALRRTLLGALNPLRNAVLVTGALAIKAGGSAVVATASAVTYLVGGKLATLAAGDMAALVGTVSNAAFNVFVFSTDLGGTAVTRMGLEGASLAAVEFPAVPDDEAVLGFVIINPTGTGDFVGGTSVLDDGTIVPNASYINTPFAFNPYLR